MADCKCCSWHSSLVAPPSRFRGERVECTTQSCTAGISPTGHPSQASRALRVLVGTPPRRLSVNPPIDIAAETGNYSNLFGKREAGPVTWGGLRVGRFLQRSPRLGPMSADSARRKFEPSSEVRRFRGIARHEMTLPARRPYHGIAAGRCVGRAIASECPSGFQVPYVTRMTPLARAHLRRRLGVDAQPRAGEADPRLVRLVRAS